MVTIVLSVFFDFFDFFDVDGLLCVNLLGFTVSASFSPLWPLRAESRQSTVVRCAVP